MIIDYVSDQTVGLSPLFAAAIRAVINYEMVFVSLLLKEFPERVPFFGNHIRTALRCYNSATNFLMEILEVLIDESPILRWRRRDGISYIVLSVYHCDCRVGVVTIGISRIYSP